MDISTSYNDKQTWNYFQYFLDLILIFYFFSLKSSFIILFPANLCTVKAPHVPITRLHTFPAKYLIC